MSGKKRVASIPKQAAKKARLVSRKKKKGFDEEIFKETSYYIKDDLRYVRPYYFTFTTHAKGRWVGSTVYGVFCNEFQAETPEYYEQAIKANKVTVNGVNADMHTVISHNDLICHRVHRHEPPVTAQPLSIVHMDQELVVINKPSSIPVFSFGQIHPCGRYRHNSVVFLLGKEHNLRNLHTVHRLDRLTSGLLILARSVHRAQQLEVEIRERKVSKEYVCRVQGEFPVLRIECDQPILVFYHKLGLSRVDPEGKPCTTVFTRLSYNGETSVVKCEPRTGRMHQIRVHLQWLGYPIVNDPLYNHPAWKCSIDGGGGARGASSDGEREDSSGGDAMSANTRLESVVRDIISSKFADSAAPAPVSEGREGRGQEEGGGGRSDAKDHHQYQDADQDADPIGHHRDTDTAGHHRDSDTTYQDADTIRHHRDTDTTGHHRDSDITYQDADTIRHHRDTDTADTIGHHRDTDTTGHHRDSDTTYQDADTAGHQSADTAVHQDDDTTDTSRHHRDSDTIYQDEDTTGHQDTDTSRHHGDNIEQTSITSEPTITSFSLPRAFSSSSMPHTPSLSMPHPSSSSVPHPSSMPDSSPLDPTTYDPDCTDCQLSRPAPSQEQLVMYLHALTYKGENWSFATPLPSWAEHDWKSEF